MSEIVANKMDNQRKKYSNLLPHLDNLYELYQLLHTERKREGLIDFSSIESRFIFSKEGHIESIEQVKRNNAHRLIEEMMLVANIAAGKFFEENDILGIYRVHNTPKDEKLKDLRLLLSQLGLSLEGGEKPTAKSYSSLVEKIRKRDDAQMLETILLRSMPLAEYNASNQGHFGLGFPVYTHFTSPIRRYPDLIVHRIISHIIEGKALSTFGYTKQTILELADHCSLTERRAENASRDASQRLKCNFMKGKEGKVFHGLVSSVTSFGLFILLDDIHVEGLVHISTLPTDYYHYNSITHTLSGESGGKKFSLGQKLTVVLIRVGIDERKIDFELV
jgi:ribonuclease R